MSKSKSFSRRRGSGPEKIAKYLSAGHSRLSLLQQQANATNALKATLWPVIPTSLQTHCDLANFHGHTLVMVADSPVWAAKLRHTSPQILHAARTVCKIDAHKLVVKIQPATIEQPRTTRPRTLPKSSAAHLRDVAAAVDDQELKETLLAIASHSE